MKCLRPCFSTGSRICCVHSLQTEAALPGRKARWDRFKGSRLRDGVDLDSSFSNVRTRQRRRFEPWPLAAWKKDVEFTPAKIVSNTQAASQIRRIQVDIGDGARSYSSPGQFIQIQMPDSKPAFIAIASPPGADTLTIDLLVNCSGEVAEKLCSLSPGDEVNVSPVMGNGFPIDRIPADEVPQVWMFTTGTGIAPIQTALLSPSFEIEKRESVTLYYGAKNAEASPVLQDIEQWKNNFSNLTVRIVYSDEGEGYIQDVFEKENPDIDASKTGVLLCGQRDMCERITEHMTQAGVDPSRILFNF